MAASLGGRAVLCAFGISRVRLIFLCFICFFKRRTCGAFWSIGLIQRTRSRERQGAVGALKVEDLLPQLIFSLCDFSSHTQTLLCTHSLSLRVLSLTRQSLSLRGIFFSLKIGFKMKTDFYC